MTDFLLQILSMKLEAFCQLSVIEKGHVTLAHNMICLNKYNNFPKMCHLSSAHLTSAEKLLGFATMTSRYQNNSVSCLSISYGMTPLRYLWQNMTIWKNHPKHLRHLCKPFGYHTIMYETPHMHTIIPFPLCRDRSSVLHSFTVRFSCGRAVHYLAFVWTGGCGSLGHDRTETSLSRISSVFAVSKAQEDSAMRKWNTVVRTQGAKNWLSREKNKEPDRRDTQCGY